MDFSKFKFELYDILAVVLPGFLLTSGIWVLVRGWHSFAVSVGTLTGTGFTILLLASFPLGHLIQELGDSVIKKACGERHFKRARDAFWSSDEGDALRGVLEREVGFKLSVDGAFDICLTKIQGQFPRRDSFIATSDFCRSLLVVEFLLIPAFVRILWDARGNCAQTITYSTGILLAFFLFLYLAGRRMMRFRELSETTVFRIYLAGAKRPPENGSPAELDQE